MIVAAVDISASINNIERYGEHVYNVLSKLEPPINVMRWNDNVEIDVYTEIVPDLGNYYGKGNALPQNFIKLLSNKCPIDLYVFTGGRINDSNIDECKRILKENNLKISTVKLYYIGDVENMNLKLMHVFNEINQDIYINEKTIVKVELDLDLIAYGYIMKDDSFNATVILKHPTPDVNKQVLRKKVNEFSSQILKEYLKNKITITNFYKDKNITDCITYVKKHIHCNSKNDFERKISGIEKWFDENVDMYSVNVFTEFEKLIVKKVDEYSVNVFTDFEEIPLLEPKLECEAQTCDILYKNYKTISFPILKFKDRITVETADSIYNLDNIYTLYQSKKDIKNPFKILESKELRKTITDLIEPYVLDYDAYKKMVDPNISPFTGNELQGIYVLHNDTITFDALIKHNNYVLSALFQNRLSPTPILWHMVFLYILAVDKFQNMQSRLFEEIQFLGDRSKYFITLSPHLKPRIIENLNVCFWYIANVSHRAFPNSKKNILRSSDSEYLLKFYRDVYDQNYKYPEKFPIWRLWKTLCDQTESAIFNILTHYYRYEKFGYLYKPLERKFNDISELNRFNCSSYCKKLDNDMENKFQIVLYDQPRKNEPYLRLDYLSELSLNTVLSVYKYFINTTVHSYYDKLDFEEVNEELSVMSEDLEYTLSHIQINIKTCNPLVICPVTKKHWKNCIGEYNVTKYSYLRLFKRYCLKYKTYPATAYNLIIFLNKFIFDHQDKMPVLFHPFVKFEMGKVMLIFEDVMKTYSCSDYLRTVRKYSSEDVRLKYEKKN